MLRVVSVFGTRPEAIKMAPVIGALQRSPGIESLVVSTGQHRELVPQALSVFGLRADRDLGVMTVAQSPEETTVRVLQRCGSVFADWRPDVVLVHGDTTTTMSAALAAFYVKVPVGHVEAGLRTFERYSPFPEEMNRRLADHIAEVHLAPTDLAAANLQREGIDPAGIFITGNTGIDALLHVVGTKGCPDPSAPPWIVVEAHRRENLGEPIARIARAVQQIVRNRPEVHVLWSVHPNPAVAGPVRQALAGEDRVTLCDPPAYDEWARILARSVLLLTDSGGLQEEAPALGLPVLVLRESTERPEAVQCGATRLVGTDPTSIVRAVDDLLDDPAAYRRMAEAGSPYGDGHAAERIVQALRYRFLNGARPDPFVSECVLG